MDLIEQSLLDALASIHGEPRERAWSLIVTESGIELAAARLREDPSIEDDMRRCGVPLDLIERAKRIAAQ
jgi:hypothetical protein